jgi:UDP-N-acetylglucosamine 2-epimerase
VYDRMARTHNPYGDGNASARIAEHIHSFLSRAPHQEPE